MKRVIFLMILFLTLQNSIYANAFPDTSFEILISNNRISKNELVNYQFYWQKPIPKSVIAMQFNLLRKCILKKEITCVARYMMFSEHLKNATHINYNLSTQSIKSLDDFSKKYDAIFTSHIIDAIKTQESSTIQSSEVGLIVGNGELLLNYFCERKNINQCYFKIFALNVGSDTIYTDIWTWVEGDAHD
jgi:hypothetical protein